MVGRPATHTAEPAICDLRGLKCPLPVLKSRRRLLSMARGERLWVTTTDPLAGIDIPHFCREEGHLLIEARAEEGGHRFLIERGPLAPVEGEG